MSVVNVDAAIDSNGLRKPTFVSRNLETLSDFITWTTSQQSNIQPECQPTRATNHPREELWIFHSRAQANQSACAIERQTQVVGLDQNVKLQPTAAYNCAISFRSATNDATPLLLAATGGGATRRDSPLEKALTKVHQLAVTTKAMTSSNGIPLSAYVLLTISFLSFSSEGVALDMLGQASPLLKLFWRMSGASMALLPLALHSILTEFGSVQCFRQSLPKGTTTKFLMSGATYAILMVTFFFALRETSISHVYLLNNCHAILLVLFRFVCQRSKLLRRQEVVGTVLGFAGIVIISCSSSMTRSASGGDSARLVPSSMGGDLLAFIGAVAGVAYLCIVQEIRENMNEWVFLFLLTTFLWVTLLPFMVLTIPQLSVSTDPTFGLFGWAHYAGIEMYLVCVVTCMGTLGRVRSLKYFDPLIVSCTMLLEPIVASWIGIVLGYDALPGFMTVIGGLSVLCGCFLVLITAKPTTKTTAPSAQSTEQRKPINGCACITGMQLNGRLHPPENGSHSYTQ